MRLVDVESFLCVQGAMGGCCEIDESGIICLYAGCYVVM